MKNYNLPLDVKEALNRARTEDKILVLVTGVFDVLHQEHINFLNKAKHVGDVLLVGLETDKRVKILKGTERPINSEEVRAAQLERLGIADSIFLLPEDFDSSKQHRVFIRLIAPDILAVSSHSPHLREKREIVEGIGGKLKIVHDYNPDISSSKLIEENKLDNN